MLFLYAVQSYIKVVIFTVKLSNYFTSVFFYSMFGMISIQNVNRVNKIHFILIYKLNILLSIFILRSLVGIQSRWNARRWHQKRDVVFAIILFHFHVIWLLLLTYIYKHLLQISTENQECFPSLREKIKINAIVLA